MLKISSSVSPTEINTGQQRSSGIGRWSTTYIPHISPNPSNTCCPQTSIPSQHERRGAGPGGIETLSSYLAEPWILQPTRTTVKRFNILQVKSQSFLSIFNPHLKRTMKPTRKSTWNLRVYSHQESSLVHCFRTKYNVDFFVCLVQFAFTQPFLQVNQKL